MQNEVIVNIPTKTPLVIFGIGGMGLGPAAFEMMEVDTVTQNLLRRKMDSLPNKRTITVHWTHHAELKEMLDSRTYRQDPKRLREVKKVHTALLL